MALSTIIMIAVLGLLAYWVYEGKNKGTGPLAGFFGTAS